MKLTLRPPKIRGLVFLFLCFAALCSCGPGRPPAAALDIFVLKTVNDADCIVLKQGREAVVIDTGEEIDGPRIVSFLKELDIDVISCLILSHPDADHIGSASRLVEEFRVTQVVEPFYPMSDSRLDSLNSLIGEKKISLMRPLKRRYITVGDLRMVIYPPREKRYKNSNNYSLAALCMYGASRMLFAGDALEKRLRELMDTELPKIDLLKIPHHGRANNSSAAFIAYLSPDYAAVTAGQSDSAVSAACALAGAGVYYTGLGDLHFVTDGITLTLLSGACQ